MVIYVQDPCNTSMVKGGGGGVGDMDRGKGRMGPAGWFGVIVVVGEGVVE